MSFRTREDLPPVGTGIAGVCRQSPPPTEPRGEWPRPCRGLRFTENGKSRIRRFKTARWKVEKPSEKSDKPVSPPARGKSGGLVPLGGGGLPQGGRRGQACLFEHRVQHLHWLPLLLPSGAVVSVMDRASEHYKLLNGQTAFYVCRDHCCLPPMDKGRFLEILKENKS